MHNRSFAAPIIWLTGSQLVAIAIFVLFERIFHRDLMSQFFNLVIPVGAIAFGVIGSAGSVAGVRLANYPARKPLLKAMLLATVGGFFVYLLIAFATPLIYGIAPASSMSFAQYIDDMMAHSSIRLSRNSDPTEIGRVGYALLAAKFAGALGGAYAVYYSLKRLAYCNKCLLFITNKGKRTLSYPDVESWQRMNYNLPDIGAGRAEMLMQLPKIGSPLISRNGTVIMHLRRGECPSCHEQHMSESVIIHVKGQPRKISELSQIYRWGPVSASRVSDPQNQATRGFGRKVM